MLPVLLLSSILLGGCIAAVPMVVKYFQTENNYVATATARKSADDIWLAALELKEEAETERGIKILKQDDTKRLIQATDGVQTAEVKVLDEGSRTSKIIIIADVPEDGATDKELIKEKELAARIMKNLCAKAEVECQIAED